MAILCGIDPGVNTGLAIWDTETRSFRTLKTCTQVEALLDIYTLWLKEAPWHPFRIVAEDARKRTWIPREKSVKEMKGRAMGAGSVKRSSQIWEEFSNATGIQIDLVPPRKGLTKWDADYFKKVTGWTGRTSNHARDAALLVFGK